MIVVILNYNFKFASLGTELGVVSTVKDTGQKPQNTSKVGRRKEFNIQNRAVIIFYVHAIENIQKRCLYSEEVKV